MPRKSNSVNMYGKSWGPIDEQNLKNAIKLMEQLNKLAENFAGSLSGVNKITNQINEASRLKNELDKVGVKLNKEQAENVLKALNAKKQQNTESKKYNDLNDVIDSVNRNYSRGTSTQLTSGNFGSTVSGAIQQKQARNILQQQLSEGLKNAGQKDIKSGKILDVAYKETADKLNKSAGKYSKAANILQVAADTFSTGVKTLVSLFKSGIDNQYKTYENTFSNLATRTGVTRSQYYTTQAGVPGQLSAMDMYDNVRVSEVQKMWGSLAESGFSQEDVFARAIDNVVTNKIVPYLDTTSTDLNLLNNRLDGNFIKQIRGINLATQDISGSTLMNEEVLKSMLDAMAPITDNAIQNLAKESTEMSNLMNYLVDEVGMTKDQAMSYATQVYKQQNYGHQIMSSGSTYERVAYNNNLLSGINVYTDPTSAVINNVVSGSNLWGGMAPGYGDTYSGLITSTIADAIGVDASTMASLVKANQAGVTREGLSAKSLMSDEEFENYKNKATEELANGDYQTNTERQEITTENAMTALATSKEWMGHYTDLIVTAIKGVGTLLTTWLGGKFLNLLTGGKLGTWLGGMFKSSGTAAAATGKLTGAGGILAGAGGIALGTIAGVAATVAIANAIKSAYDEQEAKHGQKEAEEEINGAFEIDSTLQGIQGVAAKESKDKDNGWLSNTAETVSDAFGATWMGIKKGVHTISGASYDADYAKRNAEFYNTMIAGAIKNANTDQDRTGLLLAYAYLLNEIDSLDTMTQLGSPITKSQLKDYYNGEEFSYYNVQSWVNQLLQGGYAPSGYNNEKANDPNVQNYLRQGLDYVPEDNYPALLHQGEAVLTASTANELRTLVDEYRSTNKESISFETIIQNQTSSLISKMDEMLQFMRSTTGTTTTDWRNGFITNSMKYVKSTKSFS